MTGKARLAIGKSAEGFESAAEKGAEPPVKFDEVNP